MQNNIFCFLHDCMVTLFEALVPSVLGIFCFSFVVGDSLNKIRTFPSLSVVAFPLRK